jgi:hypothetical protein
VPSSPRSFSTFHSSQDVFKNLFAYIVGLLNDTFWVMLFIIYLLFEQAVAKTQDGSGGLRARMDRQIQRYLGLKALISLCVAILVYIILGPIL